MRTLRDYAELAAWAAEDRAGPPRQVALAIGHFDGVHRGHQHLLSRLTGYARETGARSLALTFTNAPRAFHEANAPWRYLTLPEEKLYLLAKNGLDATLLLTYDASVATQTAAQFLAGLAGQVPLAALCVGYDSRLGCDQIGGRDGLGALAAELGLEMLFVEALERAGRPVKSSIVRDLVEAGAMAEAREVMGHPYFAMGSVVQGKGKGARRLALPTANLHLPADKLAPPLGVYACLAETAASTYPAATCVLSAAHAQRTALERHEAAPAAPGDETQMIAETHLAGYEGDLYGSTLALHFLERLRDWIEFHSADELQAQILKDIACTRGIVDGASRILEASTDESSPA